MPQTKRGEQKFESRVSQLYYTIQNALLLYHKSKKHGKFCSFSYIQKEERTKESYVEKRWKENWVYCTTYLLPSAAK